MKKLLLIVTTFLLSLWVRADVTVTDQVLQKGLFLSSDCKVGKKKKVAAECLCKADIHYPAISGLENNSAQSQLNQKLKTTAESGKCEGKPIIVAEQTTQNSADSNFEVTFRSDSILAIAVQSYSYGSGAAHGLESVEGIIISKKMGQVLSVNDIFGGNIAQVNQSIYDQLKSRDDIFADDVEKLKGKFVLDNQCNSCTLLVAKEGVKVIFMAYAVAPFSSGMPEVIIPKEYIADAAIIESMDKK
ncbi:MAG: DUF3298 and DUF4163 domain-containing protein [Methyloglobulus sp.]|nr:DUF3298 and DUF4163 domain-containing protein [Methyloglobulus sp.]